LAHKLRRGEATIGEVYSFMSGLYFRGKISYSEAFPAAPSGVSPAFVIVPGHGLVAPHTVTSVEQLQAISQIEVDEQNPVFRKALADAAIALDQQTQQQCCYVLLGSVASAKYTEPLLEIFGERLLFPGEFVGRGDMSRGGLMLRSARSGSELSYIPVRGAQLRGVRPPRLTPGRWQK
jgi:hypothetical protein